MIQLEASLEFDFFGEKCVILKRNNLTPTGA